MKKILILFLLPFLCQAQFEKSIRLKVVAMQGFVNKGEEGETLFWQTKGRITFGIVNYTEEQNPKFKELFINQYKELLPVFKRMNVSEDEKDTALYIKLLIRQEEDYRKMLTKEQLKKYLDKLADFEKNNPQANDSYAALFFSEELLKEYKTRFL
jgi:L-rhamnose mutarotase